MEALLSTSYCRRVIRSLLCLFMVTIALGTWNVLVSHASIGTAHFSISPTLARPYSLISRAYFVYNGNRGSRIVDSIHVTNKGTATGTLSLYTADATTAQTSGTTFLSRTAPRHDVGAWITLSSNLVTLKPGQSKEVPFTLLIPTGARAGQHGGGIIAQDANQLLVVPHARVSLVRLNIQSFMALGVLVNLPGFTAEQLLTNGISYDAKSQYQRLLVSLTNMGTQLLYPSGYLQVKNDHGQLLQNLILNLKTFLPLTTISYPVYIQKKALPLGKKYSVTLLLRYGHNHALNYTTTFMAVAPARARFANQFQNLIAIPNSVARDGHLPDYFTSLFALFLGLSALCFWGKKITDIINHRFLKKKS